MNKNRPHLDINATVYSMVALTLEKDETVLDIVRSSLSWLENPGRIEIKEIRLVEQLGVGK